MHSTPHANIESRKNQCAEYETLDTVFTYIVCKSQVPFLLLLWRSYTPFIIIKITIPSATQRHPHPDIKSSSPFASAARYFPSCLGEKKIVPICQINLHINSLCSCNYVCYIYTIYLLHVFW